MKRVLILLTLIAFLSTSLFSQTNTEALVKYEANKKSEFSAGVIEWLIPVVGHAYAGDAEKGLLPAGVSAGGLVLMIASASGDNTGLVTVGLLGYVVGRIWGIVSAVQTAEDFNKNLKTQLNLSLKSIKFHGENIGYGVTLSVSF